MPFELQKIAVILLTSKQYKQEKTMSQVKQTVIQDEDTVLIQRAYRDLLKSLPSPLEAEDKQNIRAAF